MPPKRRIANSTRGTRGTPGTPGIPGTSGTSGTPGTPGTPEWSSLRLQDRIRRDLQILFVGINPGVRSAITGHHFAGFSNRFWKLLWDSKLVPEPITYADDHRLLEFGFGITNLVARPSPGIDDLTPAEYVEGWHILDRKIKQFRPRTVALVGVTLYRVIQPLIAEDADKNTRARMRTIPLTTGLRAETIHGARIYVVPNPSGRNANFTYEEMLRAFRGLRRAAEEHQQIDHRKTRKTTPRKNTD
jgi:double-stranded uracil-DNA glycosylase